MTQPNTGVPEQTGKTDARYLMVVGGLLVVIIAALAVLWLAERSRRMDAERRLARRDRTESFKNMLPGLLAGGLDKTGLVRPVQRDDQIVKPVALDGRKVAGVFISADAGRRLGFRPGDVVIVAKAETTTADRQ